MNNCWTNNFFYESQIHHCSRSMRWGKLENPIYSRRKSFRNLRKWGFSSGIWSKSFRNLRKWGEVWMIQKWWNGCWSKYWFVNLKSTIAAELKIDELRKNLEIWYIVEVKNQEFGFSMYLLWIDTTNINSKEIHTFDGSFIPFIILCNHFLNFIFEMDRFINTLLFMYLVVATYQIQLA